MKNLIKYAVGIDVSADKLDICFSEIDIEQNVKVVAQRQVSNSDQGIKFIIPWLKKNQRQDIPILVAMEATGVYYEKSAMFLYKAGYAVNVILPNRARRYMQCLGIKSKNDKIDAQGLAQMAAEQKLKLWRPMGEYFFTLRQMTRFHEQLMNTRTIVKNQLHALEHSVYEAKELLKQQKKLVAAIEKQISEVRLQITRHIESNQEVKHKVANILKIKGLGLLSLATVLAETNGFELFNSIRQLVSYCGYDVIEHQSGKVSGKTRISKQGNSHIRRILHMPAFVAVKYQQKPFVNLYNRVYEKSHIKMKAYVAVQKKLLAYIYTLWKKNESFNESFGAKKDDTFGNDEPKPLFRLATEGSEEKGTVTREVTKLAPPSGRAKQDELPCNESPEDLFRFKQIYAKKICV